MLLAQPPTPADFVNDPTCMVYAVAADARIRVRAANAPFVCSTLSHRLSQAGSAWSLHSRRPRRILTPVCAFADPRAKVELQVIDDAADTRRAAVVCAGLARSGWFDLSRP